MRKKESSNEGHKAGQADWQSSKELKKLKNKVSKLEKEISKLESEIANCDDTLAQAEFYDKPANEQATFMDKYNALKQKLDDVVEEWEVALETLEG